MLTENLALKAPESDLTNDEKTDMIVITNTLGVNGAAVILYPDMLASLAKEYDTDFYVIPSSIHEGCSSSFRTSWTGSKICSRC